MEMKSLNLLCLIVLVTSTATFAKSKAERRLEHQVNRIENGVDSGLINNKEAARLEHGQDKVQDALADAQEDGKFSHKEKKHINEMQKNQSQKIHKAKRN